eukprot:NODE_7346_length_773_cov_73.209231_g7104_i0.p1 GENE.NODE_7346_length_773_cov_73.209231_g7104_i0~~NODE_7346_length_773_cov_73.209231_g7104_i0.p1  ORF type:complete len:224 (+),score=16.78 NODE_7346_length_773_cov_73.209231_g7104_i0:49-720(+)
MYSALWYQRRVHGQDGFLWLGNIRAASDLEWLQSTGISAVVNATRTPPFFPDQFEYHSVAVVDRATDAPALSRLLEPACEFISEQKAAGKKVLVHCEYGISRSCTIILSSMMKSTERPLPDLFKEIAALRPIVCPNAGFKLLLVQFERFLSQGAHGNFGDWLSEQGRPTIPSEAEERRLVHSMWFLFFKDYTDDQEVVRKRLLDCSYMLKSCMSGDISRIACS